MTDSPGWSQKMTGDEMESCELGREAQSSNVLVLSGIGATVFTAVLAGRILWEETFLTIRWGPQMVGFSLAHGSGVVLLFAPFVLSLWILVALVVIVVCLRRRR